MPTHTNYSFPKTLVFSIRKDYPLIAFETFWIVGIVVKCKVITAYLMASDLESILIGVAFSGATLYMLCELLWKLLGKAIFIVDCIHLTVSYGISFLRISKKFNKTDINNIRIVESNTNSYWSFPGARFNIKKNVIMIRYNEKEIKLPLDLSNLQENTLKALI